MKFIRSNRIHPAYKAWVHMRKRCLNPKATDYKNYGGRGIGICARWESSLAFWEDMGPTWKKGLSLGRIDNDGNYEPSNCRWETQSQQMRNTRLSRKLTYKGKTLSVVEWSEVLGMRQKLISLRLWLGWTPERALSTPVRKWKTYTFRGQIRTLPEWAERVGIDATALRLRLSKYKMPLSRALTKPVRGKKLNPI